MSEFSEVHSQFDDIVPNHPVVFISYSWDNEEHKAWVRKFADDLRALYGVNVLLDQYNRGGLDLLDFMYKGVTKSDRVILIGTPNYKQKSENYDSGGCKYEDQLISAELYRKMGTAKFIPVLREGTFSSSFKSLIEVLSGFSMVDVDDKQYGIVLKKIAAELWGKPLNAPPSLGPKPDFSITAKNDASLLVSQTVNSSNIASKDGFDYDVAIINSSLAENKEVLRVFGLDNWVEDRMISVANYVFYTAIYKNHLKKEIRIVACYPVQSSLFDSSNLTTILISFYHPRYLFATGVIASFNHGDINYGDIIVASGVVNGMSIHYSNIDSYLNGYERLLPDNEVIALGHRLSANSYLLNEIEENFIFNTGKPKTRLQLHCGTLASILVLPATKKQVELLRKKDRKIIGIEQEGYGVLYAANNSAKPRPIYTFLIKSVADFAEPIKTDNFQQYAMYTSAALAKHIILNELEY